ncbi:hypothetical protein AnigIFM63604_003128 [Aspergillus niger]|uniref:Uncharacterized protein n=1 Tax=Aspergillus niger TaxID=5061 RepID=A0A505HJJ2_ASPNG|nr:hypothetical protein CAN33_0038145 [Aspergillus niger]TPR02785.1 hypothetical protein CAN33_000030 [Aspergillus niger]GKZ95299.1 hypothetical protein AnigIFM59636_009038 [Aspergillus niger]GLA55909.1 hypothetical protein AnigIFM63604_003128 [Aspergillus niger]
MDSDRCGCERGRRPPRTSCLTARGFRGLQLELRQRLRKQRVAVNWDDFDALFNEASLITNQSARRKREDVVYTDHAGCERVSPRDADHIIYSNEKDLRRFAEVRRGLSKRNNPHSRHTEGTKQSQVKL